MTTIRAHVRAVYAAHEALAPDALYLNSQRTWEAAAVRVAAGVTHQWDGAPEPDAPDLYVSASESAYRQRAVDSRLSETWGRS